MKRIPKTETSRIPGQEFALDLALNKTPEPEPTPEPTPAAAACACGDYVDALWENTASLGTYDIASITFTSVPSTSLLPRAGLIGDTCPGLDLSGITVTWSGGSVPPVYQVVSVDQTWALFVRSISSTGGTQRNGTLTIGGSIVCAGQTITIGPTTLTINIGAPPPTPPS